MPDRLRLRCSGVKYRQGLIEVADQIHAGFINIETWQISADADMQRDFPEDGRFVDDNSVANTELELTPVEARALAAALLVAADEVERRGAGR